MRRYRIPFTLAFLLTVLSTCPAFAVRHHHAARHHTARPHSANVPALFLSDIHFDPLRDPVKAPRLDDAPVNQWPAILASPPSPTQEADYAAINKLCPIKPLIDEIGRAHV